MVTCPLHRRDGCGAFWGILEGATGIVAGRRGGLPIRAPPTPLFEGEGTQKAGGVLSKENAYNFETPLGSSRRLFASPKARK